MDRRDRMASEPKWYESFDEKTMTVVVEIPHNDESITEIEIDEHEDGEVVKKKITVAVGDLVPITVPVKFDVCGTCNGKGKHVNPSIDSNGISAEEFAEDPDFAEAYFDGAFDVTCYECKGRNVVPQLNRDVIDKDLLKRIDEHLDDVANGLADDYAEREAERRFGC